MGYLKEALTPPMSQNSLFPLLLLVDCDAKAGTQSHALLVASGTNFHIASRMVEFSDSHATVRTSLKLIIRPFAIGHCFHGGPVWKMDGMVCCTVIHCFHFHVALWTYGHLSHVTSGTAGGLKTVNRSKRLFCYR